MPYAESIGVNFRSKIKCRVNEDPFTSAQFAFQMIEGVDKVRFSKEDNSDSKAQKGEPQ